MNPIAVIGAGPAGLAAAEVVAASGLPVVVFEQMPSPGRKLLMAGLGGLNITHSEPADTFLARYTDGAPALRPMIEAFTPDDLRQWCQGLGETTFVGTSGRVFPESFKASPLLRAWLGRLDGLGAKLRTRHRWTGWNEDGALTFEDTDGQHVVFQASATLLALGGATWPRLGSTGAWKSALKERGVHLSPFEPSNCGFEVSWSERLLSQHEGKPLKNTGFRFGAYHSRAEAVITKRGIEGGAIYALSAPLRDGIAADGPQTLLLDLLPDVTEDDARSRLAKAKSKDSLSNRLRKALGLSDVHRALFFEAAGPGFAGDAVAMAKALPVLLEKPFGLERAISSGGGVAWDAVDSDLQLTTMPGVYAAGEMLDWEAPTGGYLLQACMATGQWAGKAIAAECNKGR